MLSPVEGDDVEIVLTVVERRRILTYHSGREEEDTYI
jgi:hypothetical protein